MRKILSIFLAAIMCAGMWGNSLVLSARVVEPNEQWAMENGWTKNSDRYEKTVEGIRYRLWCGKTAYDKLTNADYTWQIMTVNAEEASGKVVIPGEIDGFPVKSIGADTFRANENVTECILSEGIELIATGAFENCGSITKVIMAEGMKMIDANAFYNCPNLSVLQIPASVEYIGRTSFCGKTVSGNGLEQLVFSGNAPQILYTDAENGTGLSGIEAVKVNVYENTRGWNAEAWEHLQINYVKNEELPPTVAPTETEEPESTQTPEITNVPQPTQTPEITNIPDPTQIPESTEEPGPTEIPAVTEVFEDIEKDWYTEAVQAVFEQGLMTGIKGTGKFEPFAAISKAQAVQVLYNMECNPETKGQGEVFQKIKDVYREEWYANAISWAYENKIVTGDLNTKKFYPNAGITREELALVFYRYAGYKQMNRDKVSDFDGLKNAEKVSPWALEGMKWAVGENILQGIEVSGNAQKSEVYDLAPNEKTSRAQMAVIIGRFLEVAEEK